MKIAVSGQRIELGAILQNHAKENLEKVVNKYFDRATDAKVVFSKHKHEFSCIIHVNDGTRPGLVKSDAQSDDAYSAFDIALAKIEKQLRRYRKFLRNHHKRMKSHKKFVEAMSYSISTPLIDDNSEATGGDEDEINKALIIADEPVVIENISVSDAVLRLELGNERALMFQNINTGKINMIYRDNHGNIRWVEPIAASK